jgi:hypothetical protein
MEEAVTRALVSMDGRSAEFKEQVERMREFRKRMSDQGASVRNEPYSVPLMERLGNPAETVKFKLTHNA